MRILLIQPPVEDFYSTRIRTYPLGLLCVAAGPKRAGHDVRVLDALACREKKAIPLPPAFSGLRKYYVPGDKGPFRLFTHYRHFGLSWEALKRRIREAEPDVIGVSSLFTAYHSCAVKTARLAREACPRARIVMGGSHVTAVRDKPPFVDEIIPGAGEKGFMDFLGISGVEPPALPARELLDPDDYTLGGKRMTFLLASRGCPHRCAFCSAHAIFPRHEVRDPGEVLAEIRACRDGPGIRHFDLEDDNFGHDREGARALLAGAADMKDPSLSFSCMNGLAADALDPDLLRLMKRAGFRSLDLSLVSARDATLEGLGRPFRRDAFGEAARRAADAGFPVTAYFILGIPGETVDDMLLTMKFLHGLPVKICPSIFYPVPAAPLFDACVRKGYVRPDDYDSFRLTAAPVETGDFTRRDLFTLFHLCRVLNLLKGLESGEAVSPFARQCLEEFLSERALYHYLKNGKLKACASESVVERFFEVFRDDIQVFSCSRTEGL